MPKRVNPGLIDIPPKIIRRNLNIVIVADLMYINGLPFLVSISHNVMLITVSYMPSQRTADLCKGMMQIFLFSVEEGWQWPLQWLIISLIHFEVIGDVDLNVTAAAKYAPEIERCIWLIKERVWEQKARLSFTRLTDQVLNGMVSLLGLLAQSIPPQE